MADHLQVESEPGVATLMKGIVGDFQDLIKQQMTLFKTEVRSDFRKTIAASIYLIVGGVVALVGAILLFVMLAYLLYDLVPELRLWGAFGIVGVAVLVAGAVMVWFGLNKFKSFNPLPDETLAALQENLEWKTKPR